MIDLKDFAKQYLNGLRSVFENFDFGAFGAIVGCILEAYRRDQTIFTMGNGGSASTASHFAADINKGCCLDLEKKFKLICLNDNICTLLALANDISYNSVFVEPLKNFFRQNDVVIGISGSGNSRNVLEAIRYAKERGGKTIGLTGFSGGKLADLADIAFIADVDDMQKVEDLHLIVVHMIMQAVHKELHPEKYSKRNGVCL